MLRHTYFACVVWNTKLKFLETKVLQLLLLIFFVTFVVVITLDEPLFHPDDAS